MTKKVTKKQKGFVNYPSGDFLIRIKNAAMAGYKTTQAPFSKLILEIAKVLKGQGVLTDVEKEDGLVRVALAYKKKQPVVLDVKIVSRPGLRVYKNAADLAKKKGPSFYIVSTSRGLMTTKEAIKNNLGGEVLAEIF